MNGFFNEIRGWFIVPAFSDNEGGDALRVGSGSACMFGPDGESLSLPPDINVHTCRFVSEVVTGMDPEIEASCNSRRSRAKPNRRNVSLMDLNGQGVVGGWTTLYPGSIAVCPSPEIAHVDNLMVSMGPVEITGVGICRSCTGSGRARSVWRRAGGTVLMLASQSIEEDSWPLLRAGVERVEV